MLLARQLHLEPMAGGVVRCAVIASTPTGPLKVVHVPIPRAIDAGRHAGPNVCAWNRRVIPSLADTTVRRISDSCTTGS